MGVVKFAHKAKIVSQEKMTECRSASGGGPYPERKAKKLERTVIKKQNSGAPNDTCEAPKAACDIKGSRSKSKRGVLKERGNNFRPRRTPRQD